MSNYDVDDILDEVKRKRARERGAPEDPRYSAPSPEEYDYGGDGRYADPGVPPGYGEAPPRREYNPYPPEPVPYYPPPQAPQYPTQPAPYPAAPPQPQYPAQPAYPQTPQYPPVQQQPQIPAPESHRRTPKPSMDELLQNFGEGVGLGKGIDKKKPPIQPRRTPPVVGNSQQAVPPVSTVRDFSASRRPEPDYPDPNRYAAVPERRPENAYPPPQAHYPADNWSAQQQYPPRRPQSWDVPEPSGYEPPRREQELPPRRPQGWGAPEPSGYESPRREQEPPPRQPQSWEALEPSGYEPPLREQEPVSRRPQSWEIPESSGYEPPRREQEPPSRQPQSWDLPEPAGYEPPRREPKQPPKRPQASWDIPLPPDPQDYYGEEPDAAVYSPPFQQPSVPPQAQAPVLPETVPPQEPPQREAPRKARLFVAKKKPAAAPPVREFSVPENPPAYPEEPAFPDYGPEADTMEVDPLYAPPVQDGGMTRMADLPNIPYPNQYSPQIPPQAEDPAYDPRAAVGAVNLAPEDMQDDVDPEEGEPMDAAGSEQERQGILRDIKRSRIGLLVRLGVTAASFVGLLYLSLTYVYRNVPSLPFIFAEGDTMRMFLIVNVLILAASMLINSPVIGGGLVSLFTLKADNDSLVSLAMIASVIQGVSMIIFPESATELYSQDGGVEVHMLHLYFCIPVLGMVFNLIGKWMMAERIAINSRIACGESDKFAMRTIQSPDFSRELTRGLPSDLPDVTYAVRTKYLSGFLRASYAQDYSEGVNRLLVIVCLLASIGVSVASYWLVDSATVITGLTVFSALMSVCAPFTTTLVGNLPMLRAAIGLKKSDAVISGYPVVEEYTQIKAVTFKAKELFPPDSIALGGMKVFKEGQIDQAILDAASVICATDSPLAPIFTSMIDDDTRILKQVENIVYEDSMGLSAWVNGKRVLIGNAQLMQNHGIATPSRDYERRYAGAGRELLYLSNSGELVAMFALTYASDRKVADQLKDLAQNEVALIVHSTDPNIDAKRLSALYNYPVRLIKIVPASLHADYERLVAPRNRVRSTIVYSGTIMSMFRALGMIPHIKASVTLGTACQLISILIGYAVITFFAFFAGMMHISCLLLLAYQLICTAVTVAVSNFRKI